MPGSSEKCQEVLRSKWRSETEKEPIIGVSLKTCVLTGVGKLENA